MASKLSKKLWNETFCNLLEISIEMLLLFCCWFYRLGVSDGSYFFCDSSRKQLTSTKLPLSSLVIFLFKEYKFACFILATQSQSQTQTRVKKTSVRRHWGKKKEISVKQALLSWAPVVKLFHSSLSLRLDWFSNISYTYLQSKLIKRLLTHNKRVAVDALTGKGSYATCGWLCLIVSCMQRKIDHILYPQRKGLEQSSLVTALQHDKHIFASTTFWSNSQYVRGKAIFAIVLIQYLIFISCWKRWTFCFIRVLLNKDGYWTSFKYRPTLHLSNYQVSWRHRSNIDNINNYNNFPGIYFLTDNTKRHRRYCTHADDPTKSIPHCTASINRLTALQ